MLKLKTIFIPYLCIFIGADATAQDGGIDSTYGGTGIVKYTFGLTSTLITQVSLPDGSLIVATFAKQTNLNYFMLTKFNPQGAVDESYAATGIFMLKTDTGNISLKGDIKLTPAGNLQVIICSARADNKYNVSIFQLNQNGQVNSSFGSNGYTNTISDIGIGSPKISFQNDGKLIVSGAALQRYFSNGTPDTTFRITSTHSTQLLVLSDNTILLVRGDTDLVHFSANGLPDLSFGANGKFSRPYYWSCMTAGGLGSLLISTVVENLATHKIIVGYYGYYSQCQALSFRYTYWRVLTINGKSDGSSEILDNDNNTLYKPGQIPLQDGGYLLSKFTQNHYSAGGAYPDAPAGSILRILNGNTDLTFGINGLISGAYGMPEGFNHNYFFNYFQLSKIDELRVNWVRYYGNTLYLARINVKSTPLIQPTFVANKTTTFYADTVSFISTINGSPLSVIWNFGTNNIKFLYGTNASSLNPVVSYYTTGKFDVQLSSVFKDTTVSIIKPTYIEVRDMFNFTANNTKPAVNDSVQLYAIVSGKATNWQWSFNPALITFLKDSNTASPIVKFNSKGNYEVTLKVYYYDTLVGSLVKGDYIHVIGAIGLAGIEHDVFKIYPNPATTSVTIETSFQLIHASCQIYDTKGTLIDEQQSEVNEKWQINLPQQNGIYLLKINTADGKQWVYKVVKD